MEGGSIRDTNPTGPIHFFTNKSVQSTIPTTLKLHDYTELDFGKLLRIRCQESKH